MPDLGTVHVARVTMLKAFGAFVRIDGYRKEGLVHISQLVNGRRVETPDEVVAPGDEVKVIVLSTDNGRLSVSMRQVDQASGEVVPDSRAGGGDRRGPQGGGEALPELYSILKAEVAKLEGFGAFCRLAGMRRQGLLHISQVANSRVEAEDLPDILAVGQEVFVKVRRLILNIARAALHDRATRSKLIGDRETLAGDWGGRGLWQDRPLDEARLSAGRARSRPFSR